MPVCPGCQSTVEAKVGQCPHCDTPIDRKAFFVGHSIITLFMIIGAMILISMPVYLFRNEGKSQAQALYALRVIQEAQRKHFLRYGAYSASLDDLHDLAPVKNFLPAFEGGSLTLKVRGDDFIAEGTVRGTDMVCRATAGGKQCARGRR